MPYSRLPRGTPNATPSGTSITRGKTNRQEHEWYTRFFGYEYHDRHISDVLRTLGRRCDDIIRTAVETRTDHYYGRTVSHFMDEFIGYDLTYEQVRDAKECRLRKAREDYNGANAYYYKLKENEGSVRGIEAILLAMRKQILKAKKINIDMETSKTIKPEENAEASEMLGYIMGQLKHNDGKWDLTDDAGKPVIFDAGKERVYSRYHAFKRLYFLCGNSRWDISRMTRSVPSWK